MCACAHPASKLWTLPCSLALEPGLYSGLHSSCLFVGSGASKLLLGSSGDFAAPPLSSHFLSPDSSLLSDSIHQGQLCLLWCCFS